jgi:hypothetical protein
MHVYDQMKQAKLYSFLGIPHRVCLGRSEGSIQNRFRNADMRLATWFCRHRESILPFHKICADAFLLFKKTGALMLHPSLPWGQTLIVTYNIFIFWEVVGLERGPLSLVRIIEELLEWKSSGSGQENRINGREIRCADHATPSISKSWH